MPADNGALAALVDELTRARDAERARAEHAEAMLAAVYGCDVSQVSSRACEIGTRGCVVRHTYWIDGASLAERLASAEADRDRWRGAAAHAEARGTVAREELAAERARADRLAAARDDAVSALRELVTSWDALHVAFDAVEAMSEPEPVASATWVAYDRARDAERAAWERARAVLTGTDGGR